MGSNPIGASDFFLGFSGFFSYLIIGFFFLWGGGLQLNCIVVVLAVTVAVVVVRMLSVKLYIVAVTEKFIDLIFHNVKLCLWFDCGAYMLVWYSTCK